VQKQEPAPPPIPAARKHASRSNKMTTSSDISKARRGTKRVCQACNVPFYDLLRMPIICPSCGEQFVVAAPVLDTTKPRSGRRSITWTGNATSQAHPLRPDQVAGISPTSEVGPQELDKDPVEIVDDPADGDVATDPDDDIVLDKELDDAALSVLVDLDPDQPKEM
jgi:uncharacterized protein (TIGR02300 family)